LKEYLLSLLGLQLTGVSKILSWKTMRRSYHKPAPYRQPIYFQPGLAFPLTNNALSDEALAALRATTRSNTRKNCSLNILQSKEKVLSSFSAKLFCLA